MIDTTATDKSPTMTPTHNLLGRMTPAERVAGRYLRAPDGHDGDDPPADPPSDPVDPPADPDPSDPPANPADPADPPADPSLMDGGDKAEPDPATLPPEKYELSAPEGFAMDDTILAAADPVFRELGLNNDQANKLMPLAATLAERLQGQQNDAFQAMKTDWAKESKADKELGGANWAETESLVAKALDQFGGVKDSPFRKLLNETGLGNHPEMIRMFRKIGSAVSEAGELARSDAGAPTKQGREAVLYPDDVPQKADT